MWTTKSRELWPVLPLKSRRKQDEKTIYCSHIRVYNVKKSAKNDKMRAKISKLCRNLVHICTILWHVIISDPKLGRYTRPHVFCSKFSALPDVLCFVRVATLDRKSYTNQNHYHGFRESRFTSTNYSRFQDSTDGFSSCSGFIMVIHKRNTYHVEYT